MILNFMACLWQGNLVGDSDRPLDPMLDKAAALEPEINNFQSESTALEPAIDTGTRESVLSVLVEENLLYVQHFNVALPCSPTFAPSIDWLNTVITVEYVEETDNTCIDYFNLEYDIEISSFPAGIYTLQVEDDVVDFEILN